jgi:hypothetical protein
MRLSSLIGAGSGHIPKDSTAADGRRWPETSELDLCDRDRGARLVIAIRHLGHGCIVYQPVIFQGALPVNEESTAALFALAATSPEPIPVLAQMDVRRLRRSVRQQTKKHQPSNVAGGINGWDLARNEPPLGKVPAGIGSKVRPTCPAEIASAD